MTPEIYRAPTLAAAVDALAERGPDGAPLAGGTWIMRAPLRSAAFKPAYVALSEISALKTIAVGDTSVAIGAGATHAALAQALAGVPGLEALATAAGSTANPAVRGMATVGGNLSAHDFAAADLVPALLALDAVVEIAGRGGEERMGIEAFLSRRADLGPGRLLTKILLKRSGVRSAHARLPLRKAGDYPVAIVSLAITLDAAGRITIARVAVGSVETVARRWTSLETALVGQALDPGTLARLAETHGADFTGRDGVEAPGWYRVSVLPALVRRAAASLSTAAA
ncbi:FAD binding domain-containing protein [Aureimonas glaciei]|uniref:Molybdopterin dehydrogenase n=1 Tax=Aureimonas glaciei TaxID=1776957 RepID=A0A916Y3L0_9HYPH|nr:FAD binding domain-containing protein [Aureimonas glaciei]GGD29460.1 molybdopterin dehydrogenase [Aureimonas glaciei]